VDVVDVRLVDLAEDLFLAVDGWEGAVFLALALPEVGWGARDSCFFLPLKESEAWRT